VRYGALGMRGGVDAGSPAILRGGVDAGSPAILRGVSLTIDLAAAARSVSDDEFRAWAEGQTVFLSSVMGELAAERAALASALMRMGFRVRWFEEFGGRDDSAEDAYLSEVRASTIYLGLLANEYGTMLASEPYAGSRLPTPSIWRRAATGSASRSGLAAATVSAPATRARSSPKSGSST
jgi:hypothetical protein